MVNTKGDIPIYIKKEEKKERKKERQKDFS